MNLQKKFVKEQVVKGQSISLFITIVKYKSRLINLDDQTIKDQNISPFITKVKYQGLLVYINNNN